MTSALWFLRDDADVMWEFDQFLLGDEALGVQNTHEIAVAKASLRDALNILDVDDVPVPDDFPAPRLALPNEGFAPDYFSFGIYHFCSRRMRDAMAQFDQVVQFAPVELVSGGAAARAQDYRLRHVLARQPAMDLERSDCTLEDFNNRLTGERTKRPQVVRRLVLLDGFQPQTDIFRVDEYSTYVLVVDPLAERVLRAGCTGMEFSHPDNPRTGKRIERYRTVDGIAEHRVGFLD